MRHLLPIVSASLIALLAGLPPGGWAFTIAFVGLGLVGSLWQLAEAERELERQYVRDQTFSQVLALAEASEQSEGPPRESRGRD